MSRHLVALYLLPAALAAAAGELRLETIWDVAIGPLDPKSFFRAAVCPDGTVALTSGSELSIFSSDSRLVGRYRGHKVLDGAAVVGCDGGHVFLTGADSFANAGWLHAVRIGQEGLTVAWSRFVSGMTARVVVSEGQIWTLGLAHAGGGSHVCLRRFRLEDGKPLEIPELGLPPRLAAYSDAAGLLSQGALLVRAGDLLLLPANPLQLWRFSPQGALLGVKRPRGTQMEEVDLLALWTTNTPTGHVGRDRIQNAVALPDGSVVVQIIAGLRPGGDRSWLEVLDPNLEQVIARIPVTRRFGILLGSDREGYLYSSDPYVKAATLVKSRLVR